MLKSLAHLLFRSSKKADAAKDAERRAQREASHDPLDPIQSMERARERRRLAGNNTFITVRDFPMAEFAGEDAVITRTAMDAARPRNIGDSCDYSIADPAMGMGLEGSPYTVPDAVMAWYGAQSFIGYQACAILAQHWLVDKACTMSGDDACRNGWNISAKGEQKLQTADHDRLRALDVEFDVMANLSAFSRFKNIFGIRIAIFEVESDDEKYYEKPFNIDGVTPGSYKGISQIDPYWMMPMLTTESTADPSNRNFYNPEFWIISGKKYHRSHLIIARGPEPADILKPTYIFGGIPLTQRIYERVYAAERTANEAPLLSMSKRTTAIHVDLDAMAANQEKFEDNLARWIKFRDNHAVKVLGKEEVMEQTDTSLADFDSVIMNQFQLVAAIAETPATEILGTSPKGFNATGEFEMKSYNKKLTSIQTHCFGPFLDRHYLLQAKSLEIAVELKVIWSPTDTPTAQEQADLNDKKADTDVKYVTIGAISPDTVLNRLRDDELSGYNRLDGDGEASEEPGMTPENIAAYQTAGAKAGVANAANVAAGAKAETAGAAGHGAKPEDEGTRGPGEAPAPSRTGPLVPVQREPGINAQREGEEARQQRNGTQAMGKLLTMFVGALESLTDHYVPEGAEPGAIDNGRARTSRPSVHGTVQPSVRSIQDIVPPMDRYKLPKMKVHGMVMAIENPRGSARQGATIDGEAWSVKMSHHYGFIKGVTGADGDELDCFVGPNTQSDLVCVINQHDATTNEFDEHKVMFGFNSPEEAAEAFKSSRDCELNELDEMYALNVNDFKNWMGSFNGACNLPIDDQCVGAKKKISIADDSDFEENKHPLAKNGQFGKGGSGSGGSSAGSKSKKHALPALAKSMQAANGKAPTPEEFHKAATEAGVKISQVQSTKYLNMALKEKKESPAATPAAEPAPAATPAPAAEPAPASAPAASPASSPSKLGPKMT